MMTIYLITVFPVASNSMVGVEQHWQNGLGRKQTLITLPGSFTKMVT